MESFFPSRSLYYAGQLGGMFEYDIHRIDLFVRGHGIRKYYPVIATLRLMISTAFLPLLAFALRS